jgi:protein phosphatase
MIKIDYACGTHPGLVREVNEDAYFADPELGLWLIADGMGGHQSGEVASGIVARELPMGVRQGETLADAIDMAHMMIQVASEQSSGARHMGSTVVALKMTGLHYQIAWVGDSRAYLWSGQELRRLTKDHSYVQLLLDLGMILEEEMFTHPSRNVISQGLGVGGGADGHSVKVDEVEGTLAVGDTLMLCSDGLTGEIREYLLSEIMASTRNNKARLSRLIEAALAFGGADNITVILVTPVKA